MTKFQKGQQVKNLYGKIIIVLGQINDCQVATCEKLEGNFEGGTVSGYAEYHPTKLFPVRQQESF